MFLKLSLEPRVESGLCTGKRFLEFAIEPFRVCGIEIGFSSRLLLFHFHLIELADVEVVFAALVHGGSDETTLQL